MELHPLLWVLIFAAAVVGMVLLISWIIALCVAVTGHRYADKLQGKYQKQIRDLLPGKNCGQCGCESCDGFARAVLFGAASENACPYGDDKLPENMIAVVKEMQKLMEDPKPPESRKRRMKTIFEKKI